MLPLIPIRLRSLIRLAIALGTAAVVVAAEVQDDPQRFLKVPEWAGVLSTKAEGSGKRVDGNSTVTWSSAIAVQGRFTLKPSYDRRNVDELSWRGKGEATVRVSGKRTQRFPEEVIVDTFVGDYVDTFEVIISNIDLAAGTYQMAVIRDLWQNQAHKGKAIEHTSVVTNRYGAIVTHSIDPGHSWPDDGGAGFGRESPLPKTRLVIEGAMTSNNNDFLSQDGGRWITSWTIRPVGPEFEEPLKAIAGGPYTPERGQKIYLDGLQSTGKIQSFHWKFEPVTNSDPIRFRAGPGKEGRRVPVVALASIKATLTVSDGKKEDTDSVIIAVTPRDYRTPFVHRAGEQLHPQSIPPRLVKGRDLRYAGGENVCALDEYGAPDSVHILHPAPAAGSWENRGYTMKQVQDAGGPFDELWYVDSYLLRAEREVLINKYLLPGGPPPVRTAKPFYKSNQALGNDVDAYLGAVRRHELLHSELMEKALSANDPGLKIEAIAVEDKSALKTEVDQKIQAAEDATDRASQDPLPSVGFKGPIAFPDDATDEYHSMEMEI